MLIWLAVRYGTPRWQLWGLGAFALAVVRLFAFDQFVDRADFTPVVNDMFWAFAPTAAAFLAAAWCLRHREKALQPWLFPVMMLSAGFLTIWLLSFEVINFAASRIMAGQAAAGAGYDVQSVKNARNLCLVALWGIYGLGLVRSGARKGWGWLRPGGYILVSLAVGTTLVLLNHHLAMVRGENSMPIVNYSFGALAVCVSAVGGVAWLLRRYGARITDSERDAFPVGVSPANILALYALSAEVFTFVDVSLNVRNLVLVALWAAYGLGVVLAGLRRGWWWLRAQGWLLALMAIGMTMVTLNYGHFLMEDGPAHPIGNYSFGAFAICIGVVTALACLVARNRGRLDPGETALFPALVLLMSGVWKKWGWLRVAAYVMAVAACGATVILLNHRVAGVDSGSDYMPMLNPSLGAFAMCVASLYLGAYMMDRYREGLGGSEVTVRTVALAGASVLTVWGLSEEVVAFISGVNLRNLVLVALWAGYGCLLMTVGVLRRGLLPRIGGCALLALAAVVTMATLNHGQAGIGPADDWPILNYGFAGFAVCILAS